MTKLFKNPSDFSKNDFKFTKLIIRLKELSKDFFVTYLSEFEIPTNELEEFICYGIECDIVEYKNRDEVVYIASEYSVKNLMRFLENRDFIVINKNGNADIMKSNSVDMARIVNSMMKLCK